MYSVYIHTVPNGKIYIGQSKNPFSRWNNGEGYLENKAFYADIKLYGWKNIKHEIVATFTNREQAELLEANLIVFLRSEDPNIGYNKTSLYDNMIKSYTNRVNCEGVSLESTSPDINIFEQSNLPVDACRELINAWIFNETHRNIMVDRLINGYMYSELSQKYNMSTRQVQNITYRNIEILKRHLV